MILKLGMNHQAMELYKVCINHDPEMTLTYFTARPTWVANAFDWGKLDGGKLAGSMQMDRRFMLMKQFYPHRSCLPLPRGYIHVSDMTIIFKHL